MIPDRDYYADKHGKLTDDPTQYARQIAVKGCFLDPRTAQRYGVDTLVATGEPNAVRRVTGRNAASVQITKAEETEATPQEPQEPTSGPATEEPATEQPSSDPVAAEEPEAEKQSAPAKKAADQKGAKKK